MIRRLVILLLLPLYIATICRTALPFIDYAINYDLIVNELCENRDRPELQCDGRCHLNKAIQEQEENEQRDGSRDRVPTVDWSCYLASQPSIVAPEHLHRAIAPPYTCSVLFRAALPLFHPPRT